MGMLRRDLITSSPILPPTLRSSRLVNLPWGEPANPEKEAAEHRMSEETFLDPATLKESLIDLSRTAISSLKKSDTSRVERPPGTSFNDLPLEPLLSRTARQLPDRKPPPQDRRMLAWKMSFEPLENPSSLWYLQYCLTVQ